jgi:clan AA aspartic protease
MITGVVNSDEGRIRLKVEGPHGPVQEIEAVIDTGYSEFLTLPPEMIAALGLRWRSLDRGMLADGSQCLFDVYEASVRRDGKMRRVLVDEADTAPLVGMGLLQGYELRMQVRPRGKITIKRLGAR